MIIFYIVLIWLFQTYDVCMEMILLNKAVSMRS